MAITMNDTFEKETSEPEEDPLDSMASVPKQDAGKRRFESVGAIALALTVVLLSYVTVYVVDAYDPFSEFLSAMRRDDFGLSGIVPLFIHLGSVFLCIVLHIVSYIFVIYTVRYAKRNAYLLIACLILCLSAPAATFYMLSNVSETIDAEY